jgi:hypothetical protein
MDINGYLIWIISFDILGDELPDDEPGQGRVLCLTSHVSSKQEPQIKPHIEQGANDSDIRVDLTELEPCMLRSWAGAGGCRTQYCAIIPCQTVAAPNLRPKQDGQCPSQAGSEPHLLVCAGAGPTSELSCQTVAELGQDRPCPTWTETEPTT